MKGKKETKVDEDPTEHKKKKIVLTPISKEQLLREVGRIKTEGYYAYQGVRITGLNRIRAVIRRRMLDIDTRTPEEKKDEKDFTKAYADKELPILLEKLLADGKLSEEETTSILELLSLVDETRKLERTYQKRMMEYVEKESIYTEWLVNIKGISAILTANMLKCAGYCERFPHVASLWKMSGLNVVDGKAPKKTKGQTLGFNPQMRTLSYLIGDSFVKKRTEPYRGIYDAEKVRQKELVDNEAPNAPESLLHADLRARRKMVKTFWEHYYRITRNLVGLQSDKPYAFAKLGHADEHYIQPPHYVFKKIPDDKS